MTHAEFVAAYARGEIRVELDTAGSARYLSARLMLPLVRLPVLGLGVALMLVGWFFTGLGVFALGIVVPQLIKRSAPHFLLQQALQDAAIYEELARSGLLRVAPVLSARD
ncbi:MAG TPA: hypothetical protein VNK67_12860 [Burkholderiales bacterium]|nr:hypothetical protein [Burkholderiales bacterium]